MDSGLHTLGWTRQQTVDYMMANSGWAQSTFRANRPLHLWPAQATSYMLGMIEIRGFARWPKHWRNFDLRGFHDRVVGMGSITLPMLEESIEAWIAEQRPAVNSARQHRLTAGRSEPELPVAGLIAPEKKP